MPREITPQCLVVLYHKYGDSGRKPSKGPNDGNNQGGNGNGGPGGGDDGDDGDDHDGSPVPSPSPAPEVNKKKDKKKAPGDGGGGGDDDPDKDSDDSDEKFVRRMKKFLGVVSIKAAMMKSPRSRKQILSSFQPYPGSGDI